MLKKANLAALILKNSNIFAELKGKISYFIKVKLTSYFELFLSCSLTIRLVVLRENFGGQTGDLQLSPKPPDIFLLNAMVNKLCKT